MSDNPYRVITQVPWAYNAPTREWQRRDAEGTVTASMTAEYVLREIARGNPHFRHWSMV